MRRSARYHFFPARPCFIIHVLHGAFPLAPNSFLFAVPGARLRRLRRGTFRLDSGLDLLLQTPQFMEETLHNRLDAGFSSAYRYMEKLFDGPVYLETFIKVKSGWADNEAGLRAYGYE